MPPSPNEIDFADNLLRSSVRAGDPAVRQRIFEATRKVLACRRFVQRVRWGAAFVACYLAGMLTMFMTSGGPRPQTDKPQLIGEPVAAPQSTEPLPSAQDREWQALESSDNQAEKYRLAGDAYLTEQADPSGAMRCYTASLDRGGRASLEINPDDSWLLMQIKSARLKEMNDAKNVP